jgi:protein TonB
MRKLFLTIVLLTVGFVVRSQATDTLPTVVMRGGDPIYVTVEQDPEFPGGIEGLMQFLAAHLKWPSHQESDCFGRVEVSFVVETDGSVSNVKIEKDPCGKFGDEVTRVISKMPRWNPGRQDGKVVRVLYKLPINFSLK